LGWLGELPGEMEGICLGLFYNNDYVWVDDVTLGWLYMCGIVMVELWKGVVFLVCWL
jgi:hypothetical protein